MRHLIFILLLGLTTLAVSGQSPEQRYLFFGRGPTGVEFDPVTQEPKPHIKHSALIREGGCVVSHPQTGQLQFYFGDSTVYNAEHEPMAGGTGIPGCWSSITGAVAVRKPGSQNVYWLFVNTSCHLDPSTHELYFVEIDMRLNQGLGGVTNTILLQDDVNEGMVIVPGTDQENYWLLVSGLTQEEDNLFVFSLNAIGPPSVVHSIANIPGGRAMDYHQDNSGTTVVAIIDQFTNEVNLFQLDEVSGQVTFQSNYSPPDEFNFLYDVEFTPSGQHLFCTNIKTPAGAFRIDINSGQTTTIFESDEGIGGGLITGPDNRIYHIHDEDATSLSVITTPDEPNAGYHFQGLELHNRIDGINFPTFLTVHPDVIAPPVSGIINDYAAVLEVCGNTMTVATPSAFAVGDTVFIIQMQGAMVDLSASVAFGSILDYNGAGNNEYNIISSITGNTIVFENVFAHDYRVEGNVQLITVPNLGNQTIGALTCAPWNGSTGGVLIFSGGQLSLADHLDVSGRGGRGGGLTNFVHARPYCQHSYYNYPYDSLFRAGLRGEGIATIRVGNERGRGPYGNGGGAGNDHNCGGGGGALFAHSGQGAVWNDFEECPLEPDRFGLPGYILEPRGSAIFLSGGGGGGQSNNYKGTAGGNGGGIIIIRASSIATNGYQIKANGESVGNESISNRFIDGGGGGGAGGTIHLTLTEQVDPLVIEARGGRGSSVDYEGTDSSLHGHGGGGSGGALMLGSAIPASLLQFDSRGGFSGRGLNGNQDLATDGEPGIILTGASIAFEEETYVPLELINVQTTAECNGTGTLLLELIGTNALVSINGDTFTEQLVYEDLTAGSYAINITNGCDEVLQLVDVVTYEPLGGDIFDQEPAVCSTPGRIELFAFQGKFPYRYEIAGISSPQSSPLFDSLVAGVYDAVIIDDRDCNYRLPVIIDNDSYEIEVELPADTCVQKSGLMRLTPQINSPSNELSYRWNNEYIDCVDCPEGLLTPQFTSEVNLEVTDSNGCVGHDQTTVCVEDALVFAPNAISRESNSSAENHYFTLYGDPNVIYSIEFTIYDRWGEKVFQSTAARLNEPTTGWDGSINTQPANAGVYVYFYTVTLMDGTTATGQGDISIVP